MKNLAHPDQNALDTINERRALIKKGLGLTIFTVAWNVIEGVIAITAGVLANSVALISFGIDSFVESTSAGVLSWRLAHELNNDSTDGAERAEKLAAKIAGSILLLLAAYIVIDAGRRLFGFGGEAEKSWLGIGLTVISVVVMPFVARAKLKVAAAINSRALRADAMETLACTWLSVATLAGLGLNMAFGWTWADPVSALLIVPLVIKEGMEGLRGEACQNCHGD
ncbi:cation diffusion facilitator family transporter [bacterium]|jgi:cation diffusion facilitator family transporter|nr:cation diffusion facilitator family transporter [bacterium]MBP9808963.1 cation diffusion facilitator family transporter [bacterium]